MSGQGKNSNISGARSVVKKDYSNQKSIAVGFTKLRFAHKASGGDTGINLNSLVTPSEMALANPSPAQLAAAQLLTNKANFQLTSSVKGKLIPDLAFSVSTNMQINFLDWTADEGEIFYGEIDPVAATGIQVIDADHTRATGILPAGTTDFNVGVYEVNKYPDQQVGQLLVFLDGLPQFRNTGNATASPSADGNYQEVYSSGGLGSIIRFNEADALNDRKVIVVSTEALAFRPSNSALAVLETLAGQLDQIIPDLALATGNPEAKYQAQPNSVDLKAFGDRVLGLENKFQSIVVALNGDYTGGSIRISRSGNVVTINAISSVTHASGSARSSLSGLIPSWALPTTTVNNVYDMTGSAVYECNVSATGVFSTAYRDWTGANANLTNAEIPLITYTVA
jgi:hypothetical protein